VVVVVTLAMVLFGYDNAVTTPFVPLPLFVVKYSNATSTATFMFTANELDLLVCVPLIGAVAGAFIAVPMQVYLHPC
jgi:hypothetical protein